VFIFSIQSSIEPVHIGNDNMSPQWIRGLKTKAFFNKYSNFVAMFALPLNAFIFWLFYRKARYNYTEHLVACMYMIGFILLCYAAVISPTIKLLGVPSYYGTMTLSIFQVVYSAAFYYRFIDRKTGAGKIKSIVVSLASTVCWFALSGFAVRTYILNGFWGLMK